MIFRDIPEPQIEAALNLASLVFHEQPDDDTYQHHHAIFRRSRRIGAYDGHDLVGVLVARSFSLSVPGGEPACAGVTFVAVAPTHRRRGVLTGMLAELYRGCETAGQPLAALWTSEAGIYGRFGFGPGTHGVNVEIDSEQPLRLRIDADLRPLRLIGADEAPALLASYHDDTRRVRAGRVARDAFRWSEEWLAEEDEDDDEMSPPRVVVLGDPPAGYAVYRTKGEDDSAKTPGTVRVDEIEADSPAVAAALWHYLAGIDLTGLVRAWGRPLDDPLLLLAADRDQVRVTSLFPALWIRLVDVRRALERRSWASDADLVLDVRDDRVPGNAGRHRLTVTGGTCSYRRTDAAADLTVDVADLAACYLGDSQVRRMVRTGLVSEHTPGAAAALDAALTTELLPHTTDEF
ncbi:GNAT family N-acetyltransferase [Nonomuraea typhae]|uniref:GNAT family N-acetyltransferase n=1 Tax=Nonomuraea typhae TaxID=2603600 RepID=A0ABW7YZE7_9ACTN